MITQTEIDKFKEIYKQNFGDEISDKIAIELGTNLIWLIKLVAKPGIDKEVKEMHLII